MDSLLNIAYTNIIDCLPFYLMFELLYIKLKKYYDFNTSYFALHFGVNAVNTYLLLPYCYNLFINPLNNIYNNNKISYIYPMVIGLHTFHLVHNLKKINYDEIIHHILTHIFWYVSYINNDPIYIAPMIMMSGIPGGITYLLLFLEKLNKIDKLYEKKISMYLNIWLRSPGCIIFSTLLYIKNLNNIGFNYYITLFTILFTFINGVHFMHNIVYSYYDNYFRLNKN